MNVLSKLNEIISEYKGEKFDVKMETTFDELGFDSLDKVDLMMNIDEKFDISLGDDIVVNCVGDLVTKIEELTK